MLLQKSLAPARLFRVNYLFYKVILYVQAGVLYNNLRVELAGTGSLKSSDDKKHGGAKWGKKYQNGQFFA